MSERSEVLCRPEDLTAAWLQTALGVEGIASIDVERVGTGQMSETRRVRIDYSQPTDRAPSTVILKTASADEQSRSTGVGLGVYEREVRFYRELAGAIGGPIPTCWLAAIDEHHGWFTLLLEDVAPAEQGDQIAGCSIERARLATAELARIHAPLFDDPKLAAEPWLNQEGVLDQGVMTQLLGAFLERYEGRVEPPHEALCRRFVESLDDWLSDRGRPLGLVHGDYRLDNMLFGGEGSPRPFVVVDWQTVGWGPVMSDLSYFLGGSLPTTERRAHERELVRGYWQALQANGVDGFDWEDCWHGYRRQVFLGILMTVAPAMLVERTDRGDEMFLTTLARYAQQAIDLDSTELLAAPARHPAAAGRPDAADEGFHPPGAEELWNESWYFDAVSDDRRLGCYTRLGLYPNLRVCWVTAIVCGPGRPTVAVIDYAAPLPDGEELAVCTERLRIEHRCERPLERFAVSLDARAEAFPDPARLLRGDPGTPAAVAFDLAWETDGDPYAYRVATRYEIPCRASGTITLDGETIAFEGVGQRDHSWGPRDWWSAEWVWSAVRLDDGTRLHGVEFRVPGAAPLGVGYAQMAGSPLVELAAVRAGESVGADGLITAARVLYDELSVDVEPLAHGPLRLVAGDGRVSEFPRAMCAVRTADGREGVGWFEWNRNASLTGPGSGSAGE